MAFINVNLSVSFVGDHVEIPVSEWTMFLLELERVGLTVKMAKYLTAHVEVEDAEPETQS